MALFPQHGSGAHHVTDALALRHAAIKNDFLQSPWKIKALTIGMQKQMSEWWCRLGLYETREQPASLSCRDIRVMLGVKLIQIWYLIDIRMGYRRR